MLKATDLLFRRGDQVLINRMNFTIHDSQKVGVVGRNGVGKSTLFDLVQHKLHSEDGDLTYPRGWRVCHMAQEVTPTDQPALDYVVEGHAELKKVERDLERAQADENTDPTRLATLHQRYGDLGGYEAAARAGEILHGLGFQGDDFHSPFSSFSGGWRIRLNLARALMTPADLLLLDEPTNHLDLEATVWLEQWLRRFTGTLLLIAHDRDFLDQATSHTLHLHDGQATLYRGGYSSFERQRAEALVHQQAAFEQQQRTIKHMEDFVRRFRAKASKAKQAQSRLKALEKMERVLPAHHDSPYRFGFRDPERMSTPLLSMRNVRIGYDDVPVLTDVSVSILPGTRVGVLGENGAGKSTLLKCLRGELKAMAGDLERGRHAEVGYFSQHQMETLDANEGALKHVQRARPERLDQQHRDYLGGWGFDATMIERPVQTLSGGEKARLVLALIALEQPSILVLDEPTNHLDLDMRDALVLALQNYAGALVMVSHDRSILSRTVDDFWLLQGGRLQMYTGDVETYAQTQGATQPAAEIAEPVKAPNRKVARAQAAEQRAAVKPLRDRIRKLEKQVETFQAELKDIETRLADPEIYRSMPAEELDTLLRRSGRLRHKIEEAENQWLAESEALEALL
jgi:ATP-binding cassette subfamily F protein 3